jgi:hypothetical protein
MPSPGFVNLAVASVIGLGTSDPSSSSTLSLVRSGSPLARSILVHLLAWEMQGAGRNISPW